MIKIVGLGPGSKEALTIGTIEQLKNSSNVLMRTIEHPTVEFIKDIGIQFQSYDYMYEKFNRFEEVYDAIVKDVLKKHDEFGDVVYAVPGHPLVAEKSVNMLIDICNKKDIEYELFSAVSFIDVLLERLNVDPIEGIKIIDAFDINNQIMDKRLGTIVTQVYNKYMASEVKIALSNYYKDDTEIFFVRAAGIEGLESIRKMPLYELDRQDDIDHLTSVFIPKDMDNSKDIYDLIEVMDILRGENGCPWDREQTHKSLKRNLIEESYEVLEAIDEQDENKLVEELGDVLFQIVFHSRIGKEEGYFDISDVIEGVTNKMIYRHPHVFSDTCVNNSQDVIKNWDEIKKKEQGFKTYTEELEHIPKNLPALMRAEKVQNKMAKAKFDFYKVEDALNKIYEELYELEDVYKGKQRERILEEIGDLIFSVVNVARFLDIEPETALNYTIDKVIKRFAYLEKTAKEKGIPFEKMSLEQMNKLWEKAKDV